MKMYLFLSKLVNWEGQDWAEPVLSALSHWTGRLKDYLINFNDPWPPRNKQTTFGQDGREAVILAGMWSRRTLSIIPQGRSSMMSRHIKAIRLPCVTGANEQLFPLIE